MNPSTTPHPRGTAREQVVEQFWAFSDDRSSLLDAQRLIQINEGFTADLSLSVRATFDLEEQQLESLMNASISTLERRRREHKPLDPVASERLDRIAAVSRLARDLFETRVAAAEWMASPNKALGGTAPIMLCGTEIGTRQVLRVLHALEWGGVA
ncbi:type II RES/Xre toxin-antitoxin system antitoxin [gamma proteobacterium L18]